MGFVYIGTHSTDSPTMAAFPFVDALGARQIDDDVSIVLIAEAVYLVKGAISHSIVPVGHPPLKDLMERAAEAGIPVFV